MYFLPFQTIELFRQLPATTVLYFLPVASTFDTTSMDSPLHSLPSVGTEFASIEDMPISSVLFHATIMKVNMKATEMQEHKITHAFNKSRNTFAVVAFVLLKQVDEVENAVTFAADKNIGLSHFLLGF